MSPARDRRPRLSWFRFYADDFLGGTGALTAPECGRYLLLLLHQWGTKEVQVVPTDPERLRVICRGEDPGEAVLSKFDQVDGGLRNQRLADEWHSAQSEHSRKSAGGGVQIPVQTPPRKAPRKPLQIPPRICPPTKNQEPRTITTENERIAAPPAPPNDVQTPAWSQEACDDWIARFEGTAPGGVIGRHLRPLIVKYGWPSVRAAWRAYLGETESQFANPARFAATYGTWKRAPAAPAAPPEPVPPPADPEAYQFFDAMKLRLSGVVPVQSHATWLRPVDGRAWETMKTGMMCLVLACPSKEHAAQMRAWADRLRAAAQELGREVTFRAIVVREEEPTLHDGSIR